MPQKGKTKQPEALLPRLTLVLARIAEVVHWCAAGVMVIAAAAAIIWPVWFGEWIDQTFLHGETNLACYGWEVAVARAGEMPSQGMLVCFMIGAAVMLALMAMIFRNVYLILKTAQGKTWFAKGDTPFQKNIVRMFREIGIFFIATAVLSLISEIIVNIGGGELSAGFNYLGCFIGLVFLCISQFFNYGTSLEKDLDGLV